MYVPISYVKILFLDMSIPTAHTIAVAKVSQMFSLCLASLS